MGIGRLRWIKGGFGQIRVYGEREVRIEAKQVRQRVGGLEETGWLRFRGRGAGG